MRTTQQSHWSLRRSMLESDPGPQVDAGRTARQAHGTRWALRVFVSPHTREAGQITGLGWLDGARQLLGTRIRKHFVAS